MENAYSGEVLKEIFEIARSISSAPDVDALIKRINSATVKFFDTEASAIMLFDDDRETLSVRGAFAEKGGAVQKLKIRVGQGVAGTVARDKLPMIVNDTGQDPHFSSPLEKETGLVTRSVLAVPLLADGELLGVMEVMNKKGGRGFTEEDKAEMECLAALAAVGINNARLAEAQRNFFANTLEILVTAIESVDKRMSGHSWKVAQMATLIGRQMGIEGQDYKNLYHGALLHDIGLINIRSGLTLTDGIITIRDRDPEMNHPKIGSEMVRNINLLSGAVPVIRHHHENYDGTGFPEGLAGENIPLGARIVAVAETAEEMRLGGVPEERIQQMIRMGQETRFDPGVVAVYLKGFSEVHA
jgi:HD-GYP domain-containing protein (c-di-GMP phosphodiesterase class II)